MSLDADQATSSLWYVLAFVLVGSALFARRTPLGSVFRMALLWILIFGALLGMFKLGERAGLLPDVRLAAGGGTARFPIAALPGS